MAKAHHEAVFFNESYVAKDLLEFHRNDLHIPPGGPLRGTSAKWIGYAQPEERDYQLWDAKAAFWNDWVKRADAEGRGFAEQCRR